MRPKNRTRRASTLFITVRLVGLCAAASALAFVGHAATRTSAGSALIIPTRQMQPLTAAEVAATLTRIGLGPEALAAAGVTTQEVATIVSAVEAELEESYLSIRAADQEFADARADRDRLSRLVQSGKSTQQDRTDLVTATNRFLTASADRAAALDALFDIGVEELTSGPKGRLATLRANDAWTVPIQHRSVERTEEDWVQLRNALADARTAELLGKEPSQAAQQFLQTENNLSPVQDANTNLLNLTNVRQAWETALGL